MLLLLATSPLKPRPSLAGVASRRATRPSPEKKSLPFTTLVRSQKRTRFTTETGSPTKKLKDNAAEDLIPGKSCSRFFSLDYADIKQTHISMISLDTLVKVLRRGWPNLR